MHLMNKMGRVYLNWTRKIQRELLPHKITLKQQFVLRQLRKEAYLYPFQIAEFLYCDRPTATVIIKNLHRNGWVEKERDPENGKQFRVSITEDGLKKLESIKGICGPKDIERFDPLKCLNSDEREELEKLMTKLLNHMES